MSDSLQVAGATHAPLRVEATLRATATGYAIEGAGLRGKRKTMVGKVLVNTHLTTPSVDASVSLEALVYRPNGSRAEPFSDPLAMPVPYQFLNPAFVDTSLSVKVGRLAVGQAEFDQVRATLQSWHTGSANLNVDAKGRGGTLAAELKADARSAGVQLKFNAKDVTPGQWPWFQTDDGVLLEHGVTNLQAELTGTGGVLRELLAALSGTVFTEVGEGRLMSRGLRRLGTGIGTALFQTLNPFVHPTTNTNLKCAVALAHIQSGVARFDRSLALETDRASLIASGFADLGKGQLDLIAKPSVAAGLAPRLGDLAGTLRIHGPLGAPDISVGPPNPLRLGATIATAGQTWLWKGLLATLNPSPRPCEVVRHAALESGASSASQEQ